MTVGAEFHVVAVDVGGTLMKGGISNASGELVYRSRRPTKAAEGVDAVLDAILEYVGELVTRAQSSGAPPSGIGLAVPGLVDESRGIAVSSSNIGWERVDLYHLVRARFNLPVAIGHDVRAGALAEAHRGAGRGHQNFLFVPVGTGIAAAIVVGGMPFPGDSFAAGEIGHICVDPEGPPCVCGMRGCLETIAAAPAIAKRYSLASGRPTADARDVVLALANRDPVAHQVWSEAVDALAFALSTAAILYDVSLNVIGGGLATAGERLFAPLRAALSRNKCVGAPPMIVPAQLGDEAGCVGAALLIANRILHDHEGVVERP